MSNLPFTRSRVDALIKKNVSNDQVVSQRVKIAMNEWLGHITAIVAREMAKSPNRTLTVEDLKKAVHKYELADKLAGEKVRIRQEIDETNKKIDRVMRDFEKSIIKKEDEASVRIVQLHADEEFEDA